MKPWQRVLGITILVLIAGIFISLALRSFTRLNGLFILAAAIVPVSGILTIILMLSWKNRLLTNILLWAMPAFLVIYFISYILLPFDFMTASSFFLFGYAIMVNLVVHFYRYDVNMIVLTFAIILGLLFKNFHLPGAGIIITLAPFACAVFLVIMAVRAIRIKDNKYLSVVVFTCCLILAAASITFVWKVQHWPGAGFFNMVMLPVFIIATLVILLTLPGSNFIEWTRAQKRILLRGILVPWLFIIYIIATTVLIQPYNQFKPFFFLKYETSDFFMDDYEVENRNGLE